MNKNRGFTIIELMAVAAIVSILAVLALSTYSGYATRSRVAEGMNFAAEAKTSVSEYYYSSTAHVFPENNRQAGLAPPESYAEFNFVSRLLVTSQPRDGTIAIIFKLPGTAADNRVLKLVPDTTGGIVSWTCQPGEDYGLDRSHAPPSCRGT